MTEEKKTLVANLESQAEGVAASTKNAANSMVGAVRRVLLAGVGAVALTKDEVEDFVAKLVERGEIAEQDGRNLVKEIWSRRRQQVEEELEELEAQAEDIQEDLEGRRERVEAAVDEQIEKILARLNVPTKGDIDGLSAKISMLSEKVEALKDA